MIWFDFSEVPLRYPGYFTGATALSFWGVSVEDWVPAEVATLADMDGSGRVPQLVKVDEPDVRCDVECYCSVNSRTYTYTCILRVCYVRIPEDLWFGTVRRGGVLVALPEKALLDGYLFREWFGLAPCHPDNILWDELDVDRFAEFLLRSGRPDVAACIPPGGDVFTADRDEFRERLRERLREAGYPVFIPPWPVGPCITI